MRPLTDIVTPLCRLLPDSTAALRAATSSYFSGNFNPALNALTPQQLAAQLPAATAHLRSVPAPTTPAINDADRDRDFFGSNPYWLRADQVEEYRASLYSKLAHNAAGQQAALKLQSSSSLSSSQAQGGLPVPKGFRPAFFTTSTSSPVDIEAPPPPYSPPRRERDLAFDSKPMLNRDSGSVSTWDLLAAQRLPSPPSSSSSTSYAQHEHEHDNVLRVAGLAQQTLLRRMTQAFCDAFESRPTAGSSSSTSPSSSSWDVNKIAAVVSGQAKLCVVPSSSSSSSPATSASSSPSSLSVGHGTNNSLLNANADVDADLSVLGLQLGGLSLDRHHQQQQQQQQLGPCCSFEEIRKRLLG